MPKYVVGAILVVLVIFSSIGLTIIAGSTYMNEIPPSEWAKEKEDIWGHTGWNIHDPFMTGANAPTLAGKGKTIFIREGCWWCHTLLPEQTQAWTYRNPRAVTPGSIMPAFMYLSDEDLDALVAFLESLE
jgi:cytochrome c oxidase cbb3-type subunit 2